MHENELHPASKCGFTLVEILVVISAIAVLIAILIPTIAAARRSGLRSAELAHQRQVGITLSTYAVDHKDTFPFFGTPGTNSGPLIFEGEPLIDWYWAGEGYWGFYIWLQGYEGEASWTGPAHHYQVPTIEEIRTRVGGNVVSLDKLTYTAFAPPGFWKQESPQPVDHQNVQRFSSVAHSSQKGILKRWDFALQSEPDGVYPNPSYLVWFADGHVEPLALDQMNPSVPLRGVLTGNSNPVAATKDGLLGRDI